MTNKEFVQKLKEMLALNTKYMWGTWGQRITFDLIQKKKDQYPDRYSDNRVKQLQQCVSGIAYLFDCAGLIKLILWGFPNAKYQLNNVPDTNVSGFKARCGDLSHDFSKIMPGELVFMTGHVGIYVGNNEVVEATLGDFGDGLSLTTLSERKWDSHGKLKHIEYIDEEENPEMIIKVHKVGLYVRQALEFNSKKKPSGKILAFCKIGGQMNVIRPVPGLQQDGYQWFEVEYNGVKGFSQYDSMCYTVEYK